MKTKTKGTYFLVDPTVHENFKKIAFMTKTSQSDLLNELLKRFNNKHQNLIQQHDTLVNKSSIQW